MNILQSPLEILQEMEIFQNEENEEIREDNQMMIKIIHTMMIKI